MLTKKKKTIEMGQHDDIGIWPKKCTINFLSKEKKKVK